VWFDVEANQAMFEKQAELRLGMYVLSDFRGQLF
jgi:hypothetical protein